MIPSSSWVFPPEYPLNLGDYRVKMPLSIDNATGVVTDAEGVVIPMRVAQGYMKRAMEHMIAIYQIRHGRAT